MANKQLEIYINARDNASAAFRQVGNSADQAGGKIGGLDSLLSEAKGFKSGLRQVKNVALAIEVGELGVKSLTTAWTVFTGTAEQAAEAQAALQEQIKSIPIVGRAISAVTTTAGDWVAKLFGKQTVTEQLKEIELRKKALEAFAKTREDLAKKLATAEKDASTAGLSGGQKEKAEADAELKEKLADLQKQKKAVLDAGRFTDNGGEIKELEKLRDLAIKTHEQKIRAVAAKEEQAKLKAVADDQEFTNKLIAVAKERAQAIGEIDQQLQRDELEYQNRGFEARLAQLSQQADRDIEAIKGKAKKEIAELDKEWVNLKPLADAGDAAAKARMKAIEAAMAAADNTSADEAAVKRRALSTAALERDKEIRDARLRTLEREAALGNQAAVQELEWQRATKDLDTEEAALTAIIKDQTATEQQRIAAKKELAAVQQSARDADQKKLDDSEMFVLQQKAALGDKVAEKELKRIEITKKYAAEREKLLAVMKDENATEAQKASADKKLAGMDELEKKEQAKALAGDLNKALPQLVESRTLTGSANGEKDAQKNLLVESRTQTKLFQTMQAALTTVAQNTTPRQDSSEELK